MMFASASPTTLRHIELALRLYLATLRRDGYPAPPELLELLRTVADSRRQPAPELAVPSTSGDGEAMPLAVTYEEAGRMLSVSERTVQRLVSAGVLPTVEVGAQGRRISVADIRKHLSGGRPSRRSSETAGNEVSAPRTVPGDLDVVSAWVPGHPRQQEVHA